MDKAEPDERACLRSVKSYASLDTPPAPDLTETCRANRIHPDDKDRVLQGARAVIDWVDDQLADAGRDGLAACEPTWAAPGAAGCA